MNPEESAQSYDYIFKIILIGSSNVGKTSLIVRFCDGTFTESYSSTIGIDFRIKTININGKIIKMQLWDTAGQERYQAITSTHYRGADGCICVYDITNEESFEKAQTHIKKFQSLIDVGQDVQFLVGNKSDLGNNNILIQFVFFLDEQREISTQQGNLLSEDLNFQFLETSVKDNTNIEDLFQLLGKAILEKKIAYDNINIKNANQNQQPIGIDVYNQEQDEFKKKKKSCC